MNKIRDGTKWFSKTEIIDVETGEIITKSEYERNNYRTITKEKNHELKDKNGIKYGTITHRWLTKPNEQQRLFD